MSRIANDDQGPGPDPISQRQHQARSPLVVLAGAARGRAGHAAGGGYRLNSVGDTTRMTAVGDGLEHEIAGDELNAGRVLGRYRSLCSAVIVPAALTVPVGVPCRVCAVEAAPAPELAEQDSRRSRRETASWLRGLRARTARLATSSGGLDVAA